MSQTSATTRRIVRTLAHRKLDWSADVWKAAPIVQNVSQFRSWVATAEAQAEKYKAAPGPIDFASAKKAVRDKELVEFMETFYKSAKVPAETYEWDKDDKEFKLAHFEQVKEQAAVYAELKEDTLKEIEFLKSTRTSADTTIHELMCNNPTIHEEIEDELERREWFKDVGIGAGK
ncbi:ATP synthase D chain, mitochondrial ATP5H [Nitzschia inconspicua]|uniref:ATP synthase D chain, mitochondrial ATP5H n=1 Tax=Nitzschia inconspicua TaxID=303405 RepID=A0A9K3PW04_9STRA|nr:ATP synthase D chain, mitochondrial ATP5H [Nitzschia inconspicua]